LFTLREIENFCKANEFHFVFASAFDILINKNKHTNLLRDKSEHIDIVNWDNFIPIKNARTFMDMLNRKENPVLTPQQRIMAKIRGENVDDQSMYDIQDRVSKLKMPTKYITPCCHWTIEGQFEVAKYLFVELRERGLV
jgi:uncharacterized radical SAM superfamily Fe-S cluster-containing enzyme